MPIRRRLTASERVQNDELRQRLAQEFRQPQEAEPEPIVVEETTPGGSLRLWVIWSRWGTLSMRERAEVVLDAYEDARGRANAVLVASATGLTPDEASRMGLQYV